MKTIEEWNSIARSSASGANLTGKKRELWRRARKKIGWNIPKKKRGRPPLTAEQRKARQQVRQQYDLLYNHEYYLRVTKPKRAEKKLSESC